MGTNRLYNAIGLCRRAGKAKSGAFAAENAIRSGKAKLVLLEEGASEATKTHYEHLCAAHGVPLVLVETVGSAIGKDAHIVMAVTDPSFRDMIERAMRNTDEKRG
ncbi:MAG: ribosomal L7Ae/L30e/S12e/Gadd45 family protein [Clostridia bacterium]|nr:ribosomal L7Ae/L30e/S12e/Gadd45 family protein [Clostridia bacterium]